MNYSGPDRRHDRDNLPARMASVEMWQDMHQAECEKRYAALHATTTEIKAAVASNGEKRQAQHEENQRQMNRMEKRLLYAVLSIAGLFIWEYFIKRLYLG